MANARHLTSPAGVMQIIHLIFGAISIGCGAAGYESQMFKERFYLWSVVAIFIISVILLVAHLLTGNRGVRAGSAGLHVFGGILLLVAGTLMILSVKHIGNNLCKPNPWGIDCEFEKTLKLVAASFTIVNGVFYLLGSALVVLGGRNDDDGYEEAERTFARPSK